jgi:hypothetical protein
MEFDVMDSTFLQAMLECGDRGVDIIDMIVIIDYVKCQRRRKITRH